MQNPRQLRSLIFNSSFGAATVALAIAFMLIVVVPQPAQAQSFQVIHSFSGGVDGATPLAGVTVQGENLYGTAFSGGAHNFGAVFQLKKRNGNWLVNPLYGFSFYSDGANPWGRVVFGPDGALHGTTTQGGEGRNYAGTVFKLQPSPTTCATTLCPWRETVSYAFLGSTDGFYPTGDVTFDPAGNIYGTTAELGINANGTVYELSPSRNWGTETTLYTFTSGDGAYPFGGVIRLDNLDNSGDLYGTTDVGGHYGAGTVFQLLPSGPPYTENRLYTFQGGSDGAYPVAGLVADDSGNLYGAAAGGGTGGGGTVFELTPYPSFATFKVLYSFTETGSRCPSLPAGTTSPTGPLASLTINNGNLYGTTCADGLYGYGNVFELTPFGSGWTYTDLYDFTGSNDGAYPISEVSFDTSGNLYGTTSAGGTGGVGVVWEITGLN
jgi:uncharacterized repeat protein (TIGR03803 family)